MAGGFGEEPWGTFPWGGSAVAVGTAQPDTSVWLVDIFFAKRGHVRVASRDVTLLPSQTWASVALGLGGATACWLLNEGSGDTAFDSGRGHYDLVARNTGIHTYGAQGPLRTAQWTGNTAASLHGGSAVNGFITVPPGGLFNPHRNPFSLEIWCKLSVLPTATYGFFQRYPGGTSRVRLQVDSAQQLAFDAIGPGGGGTVTVSNSGIVNGDWHHLVGVRTGAGAQGLKVYVDSVLVGTQTEIIAPVDIDVSAALLCIGDGDATNSTVNGDLFGAAWYDRALSAAEIQRNYFEGVQGPTQRFLPVELRNR
jgi:Concanavalin A-like lectin/glucanases superfamily